MIVCAIASARKCMSVYHGCHVSSESEVAMPTDNKKSGTTLFSREVQERMAAPEKIDTLLTVANPRA